MRYPDSLASESEKEDEEGLKTLKDCKDLNEAREEGIKWVKCCYKCNTPRKNCDACSRFKSFFNITPGELE